MAKWRIGVAALTLAVLGPVPRVLAQTYAPTFDLVVSGTIVQVKGSVNGAWQPVLPVCRLHYR